MVDQRQEHLVRSATGLRTSIRTAARAVRCFLVTLSGLASAVAIPMAVSCSAAHAHESDACRSVQVKFRTAHVSEPPEELLPASLRESVASITPLFTLGDSELERLGAHAAQRWFSISLKPGADCRGFIDRLKRLDSVEVAEPAPEPAAPP